MRGAATIIEQNGRVLLLERSPDMLWMPDRWNLPSGHIDPDETPAQAAVREVLEETSLHVKELVPFARALGPNNVPLYVFYATHWIGRVQLNCESTRYAWVPRASVHRANLIPPQRAVLRKLT